MQTIPLLGKTGVHRSFMNSPSIPSVYRMYLPSSLRTPVQYTPPPPPCCISPRVHSYTSSTSTACPRILVQVIYSPYKNGLDFQGMLYIILGHASFSIGLLNILKSGFFCLNAQRRTIFGVAWFSYGDEWFSPNEYLSSRMGLSLLCAEWFIELSNTYSP